MRRLKIVRSWRALPLLASLLLAAFSTSLLPTSDALWSKVLTITGEVNTGDFGAPPDEDEGCTPGFWKQSHHFDEWPEGYAPDQMIGEAFELAVGPDITLLEALQSHGGDLNALLRHAVAALLNAAHTGVNFPYTVDEVIALFQKALADGDVEGIKDLLEQANEAGCPLPDDGEDEDGDDQCAEDEGHEHDEDQERGDVAHHEDGDGDGEDEGENDLGYDEGDDNEDSEEDDEECGPDQDGDHDKDGDDDEEGGDNEQGDVD